MTDAPSPIDLTPPKLDLAAMNLAQWQLFNQLCRALAGKGILNQADFDAMFMQAGRDSISAHGDQAHLVIDALRVLNSRLDAELDALKGPAN